MWCGIKFIRGYRCIRSQLYHTLLDSETGAEAETEEFSNCFDSLDDISGGQQSDETRSLCLCMP